jgi:hypothetical protein
MRCITGRSREPQKQFSHAACLPGWGFSCKLVERVPLYVASYNLKLRYKISIAGTTRYPFPPDEAFRLAQRLEIHYTPKYGSCLNIAEIELSAMAAQCLGNRLIPWFNDYECGTFCMAYTAKL